MRESARIRLVSMAVLFLVLVTGFLLGMAWDRTDGILQAGETVGEVEEVAESADGDAEAVAVREREEEEGSRDEDARSRGDADRDDEREGDDGRERDGGESGREGRRLIVHRVGISPAQEVLVDSIVDLHGDRVRRLRRAMEEEWKRLEEEYDPRFQAVLLETRSSIRSLLSDEKAVRYDSLLAEHDRREAEKRGTRDRDRRERR